MMKNTHSRAGKVSRTSFLVFLLLQRCSLDTPSNARSNGKDNSMQDDLYTRVRHNAAQNTRGSGFWGQYHSDITHASLESAHRLIPLSVA